MFCCPFAQFEREVIGERIRDKIAASKRKGMWMGGVPPLGYRSEDRKLVIIHGEAEIVRFIFCRYAELGSVRLLKEELDARGIKSKSWTSASGHPIGGKPFSHGALYLLLQNRTYLGEIVHTNPILANMRRLSISRCGMPFSVSSPAIPPSATPAHELTSPAYSVGYCSIAAEIA
jgi:hypothetical protein